MRKPGRFLLTVSRVLGLTRLRETVILPAVADMQHECAEADSDALRAWVIVRGYWSMLTGSAFYVALLPARHVRENWAGLDAAGPRLLRETWPAALVVVGLNLGLGMASWPDARRLGVGVLALLAPGMLLSAAPLALAIGLGWALARDRSGARAAFSVGIIGAALSFGFFDLAVTRANQEYRVASYRALTGRSVPLREGSREMTLHELGVAADFAVVKACPLKGAGCSCSEATSPAFLRTEWHNRLSIPALALSFAMLAAALSQSGRRAVVVPGLVLAWVAAFLVLRFAEPYGIQGEIPIAIAVWAPHLIPLTLAGVLRFRMRKVRAAEAPAGSVAM